MGGGGGEVEDGGEEGGRVGWGGYSRASGGEALAGLIKMFFCNRYVGVHYIPCRTLVT